MAGSGQKKSIRSRVMGAAGLGLLALGIWLGSMLKGPGLGEGDGGAPLGQDDGDAASENTSVSLGESDSLTTAIMSEHTMAVPVGTGDEERIVVMLYKDGYRLPKGDLTSVPDATGPLSDEFLTVELDDVTRVAAQTTGNNDGKRVLLILHESSTRGALNKLMAALKEVGVDPAEVDRRTGFAK